MSEKTVESFSNANLKEVKAHVDYCGKTCQTCGEMKLPALLARLESSEKVAEELAKVHGHATGSLIDIQSCTLCPMIKAWRKAARKVMDK